MAFDHVENCLTPKKNSGEAARTAHIRRPHTGRRRLAPGRPDDPHLHRRAPLAAIRRAGSHRANPAAAAAKTEDGTGRETPKEREERPPVSETPKRNDLGILDGDPGRIRTCDHQLRRLVLYPAELRGRGMWAQCVQGSGAPARKLSE